MAVCGDLKMITFLKGLQQDYTKHSCFHCLLDSHVYLNITTKGIGLKAKCEIHVPGKLDKVLMPPMHIKLVLAKQFVKALNTKGDTFKHLFDMFSHLKRENFEQLVTNLIKD